MATAWRRVNRLRVPRNPYAQPGDCVLHMAQEIVSRHKHNMLSLLYATCLKLLVFFFPRPMVWAQGTGRMATTISGSDALQIFPPRVIWSHLVTTPTHVPLTGLQKIPQLLLPTPHLTRYDKTGQLHPTSRPQNSQWLARELHFCTQISKRKIGSLCAARKVMSSSSQIVSLLIKLRTGISKKMDGIWNRYNLKSTGRIYTFGVLKCSEKFKVLDLP